MTKEEEKNCDRWHKWHFKLDDLGKGDLTEREFIDEVMDLESQIDSLSDILAANENRIKELEHLIEVAEVTHECMIALIKQHEKPAS